MSNLFSFSLANDSIILSFRSIPVGLFQLEAKFMETYGNSWKLKAIDIIQLLDSSNSRIFFNRENLYIIRAKKSSSGPGKNG